MDKAMEAYRSVLIQKRYSRNTQKVYLNYFSDYYRSFSARDIDNISKDEINAYILELIESKYISASQQN
ncbi:MAG: phage integrase N-terminal SAM-like domain-containing protein, partial [Candidatus Neomarinimicrobiota bacterium]